MVKLNLITAPTYTDFMSVNTVKDFLRVDWTAEDTLIGNLLQAGYQVAENYCNSSFLQTEYTLTMENWSDVYVSNHSTQSLSNGNFITRGGYVGKDGLVQIYLPLAPLVKVTHLKYYDSSGVQQTFSDSDYSVNTFLNQKGFIEINDGVNLPTLDDRADAIEIKFTAGYGDDSDDNGGTASIPEPIKTAVLLIIGRMFEVREDSVSRLPKASEYLLDPYRFKTY